MCRYITIGSFVRTGILCAYLVGYVNVLLYCYLPGGKLTVTLFWGQAGTCMWCIFLFYLLSCFDLRIHMVISFQTECQDIFSQRQDRTWFCSYGIDWMVKFLWVPCCWREENIVPHSRLCTSHQREMPLQRRGDFF